MKSHMFSDYPRQQAKQDIKKSFEKNHFQKLIEANPFKAYAKMVVTASQDKAVQKRVEEKMSGLTFTSALHLEAMKQALLELHESGII